MQDRYCRFMDEPRKQPEDPDLNFAGDELREDDPKVVDGLNRLRKLRAAEGDIPDVNR